VKDGGPTLAILLVGKVEGDGGSLEEGSKGAGDRKDQTVDPTKGHILDPKLHCPSPYVFARHRIFTYSKKEEEVDGDQVGCCTSESSVRFAAVRTGTLHCSYR
jgi:hypothetical protein